jgi:hypothetical protein
MHLLWNKLFLYFFRLFQTFNPLSPLDDVIRLYLVYIFLLITGQGSSPCIPLAGKRCKFYATFFDPLLIPTLLVFTTPALSQSTFVTR